MWYIAQLATELNLTLENIAQTNIDKLQERMKNNLIHGSGDNR
jgi:NTP pyrophosphatase (non-canonical NTP hydrolase)